MKANVSEITEQGFKLHIQSKCLKYDKTFYVSRDVFSWFLGATDEELMDVSAFPDFEDEDEHGHAITWNRLDVILGSLDFEHPEERSIHHASHSERDNYYASQKRQQPPSK